MSATTLIVIVAVGVATGALSGLVGIGGGVLMVPFLYFFYDRPDLFGVVVDPEARAVLAHGTSLLVIVPISIRGALAYQRASLVDWSVVWPVGVTSVFGAIVGARLAVILPPEILKTAFGVLLIVSGVRLAYRRAADAEDGPLPEPQVTLTRTIPVGLAVGVFSALLGVGGGIVGIPLLVHVLKMDIRKVAATSIGIIGLTATAGVAGYVVAGWNAPGLPAWSLGYVHLAAAAALGVGAFVSVRWGTVLNQRLSPRALEVLFGLLFVALGLRLAGANLLSLVGEVLRMP